MVPVAHIDDPFYWSRLTLLQKMRDRWDRLGEGPERGGGVHLWDIGVQQVLSPRYVVEVVLLPHAHKLPVGAPLWGIRHTQQGLEGVAVIGVGTHGLHALCHG